MVDILSFLPVEQQLMQTQNSIICRCVAIASILVDRYLMYMSAMAIAFFCSLMILVHEPVKWV